MNYDVQQSIEVLRRTPDTLNAWLNGLPDDWVHNNEGPDTWSPYDVVGHLVHGEKTDWIARMEIILSNNPDKRFKVFDRFAMFTDSIGKDLQQLLQEFKTLRQNNLHILESRNLTAADLSKTGIHPAFGEVTLSQLLATWTAHDLGHLAQIARVMAKQYTEAVGPVTEYLSVFRR